MALLYMVPNIGVPRYTGIPPNVYIIHSERVSALVPTASDCLEFVCGRAFRNHSEINDHHGNTSLSINSACQIPIRNQSKPRTGLSNTYTFLSVWSFSLKLT